MAADARVAPIKSFAFIVALSAHDCHLPQQTAMRGQVKETYNNAENENPTHAPDQDEMKALKKKQTLLIPSHQKQTTQCYHRIYVLVIQDLMKLSANIRVRLLFYPQMLSNRVVELLQHG